MLSSQKYLQQTPVSQTLHRGVQRVQPGRAGRGQQQQQPAAQRGGGSRTQRVLPTVQTDAAEVSSAAGVTLLNFWISDDNLPRGHRSDILIIAESGQ